MKTAYFNCSSGIAGDMMLASLISAGLDYKLIEKKLKSAFKIKNWKYEVNDISQKYHVCAKQLIVKGGEIHFKSPFQIRNIILKAALPPKVKENSVKILDKLIRAESKAHGIREKDVHFHELNSIDTLVDIAGVCYGLEIMGIEKVYCSTVNIGNPAPATMQLMKMEKIKVYSNNSDFELATPTGMAIISTVSSGFGIMPVMTIEKTGISTGTQDVKNNVLKVLIGQSEESAGLSKIILLECNIDDMDPRVYPYVIEKLLSNGAKDAWLTQILMKKGRPAIKISVLCDMKDEGKAIDILFLETTTLGVRRAVLERYCLERSIKNDIKTALYKNKIKAKSEFEIIKKRAINTNKQLYRILK